MLENVFQTRLNRFTDFAHKTAPMLTSDTELLCVFTGESPAWSIPPSQDALRQQLPLQFWASLSLHRSLWVSGELWSPLLCRWCHSLPAWDRLLSRDRTVEEVCIINIQSSFKNKWQWVTEAACSQFSAYRGLLFQWLTESFSTSVCTDKATSRYEYFWTVASQKHWDHQCKETAYQMVCALPSVLSKQHL